MTKNKTIREEDKMQQWEYKIVIGDLGEPALNEIGINGWEMCGAVQPTSSLVTLYFKRLKMPEKRCTKLDVQHIRMENATDEQKDNLIKVKPGKREDNENKNTDHRKQERTTGSR